MQMLKMCLNPRVLLGLGAVAVAIYVLAPGLLVGAVPLLVLAVCPLSMLLMMRMMGGAHHGPSVDADAAAHMRSTGSQRHPDEPLEPPSTFEDGSRTTSSR